MGKPNTLFAVTSSADWSSQVDSSRFDSRKPLVDYAGVTPELQEKFGTGAPNPYDDLNTRPVLRTVGAKLDGTF
jgi:hypothetical protein